MKFQGYSCLLFSLVAVIVVAKKKGKLKITTEFMPEDCFRKADNGDVVEVHYTGTLEDGTVFDSSRAEGRDPIQFELGSGKVIPGWEQGIKGMCVGEKRRLIIPPHLGYGDKGAGPIPGGATLMFETELVSVQKGSSIPSFDVQKWIPLFAVPIIVAYVIYQLWVKATNAPSAKELKASRKKGKKK